MKRTIKTLLCEREKLKKYDELVAARSYFNDIADSDGKGMFFLNSNIFSKDVWDAVVSGLDAAIEKLESADEE
jgi:hypothetical protein